MSLIVVSHIFVATLNSLYEVIEDFVDNVQFLEDVLLSQDVWNYCNQFIILSWLLYIENIEV
jgi:hypothetical protein